MNQENAIDKRSSLTEVFIQKVTLQQLVILCYVLVLGVSALFGYVLFPEQEDARAGEEVNIYFLITIIIAPFIETWLVQYLVIEYTYKWFKKYWVAILLSTTLFSVLHHYSIPYMAKTFITGYVYACAYTICTIRKWNGILWVGVIHLLYNLTAFVFNYILKV